MTTIHKQKITVSKNKTQKNRKTENPNIECDDF